MPDFAVPVLKPLLDAVYWSLYDYPPKPGHERMPHNLERLEFNFQLYHL